VEYQWNSCTRIRQAVYPLHPEIRVTSRELQRNLRVESAVLVVYTEMRQASGNSHYALQTVS